MSGYLGALRNGDRASEIDDAVQEIMVKVYRSIDRFDRRRNPSTWVYSIARNHCIDIQRRTRTRGVRAASDVREEGTPGARGAALWLARVGVAAIFALALLVPFTTGIRRKLAELEE